MRRARSSGDTTAVRGERRLRGLPLSRQPWTGIVDAADAVAEFVGLEVCPHPDRASLAAQLEQRTPHPAVADRNQVRVRDHW